MPPHRCIPSDILISCFSTHDTNCRLHLTWGNHWHWENHVKSHWSKPDEFRCIYPTNPTKLLIIDLLLKLIEQCFFRFSHYCLRRLNTIDLASLMAHVWGLLWGSICITARSREMICPAAITGILLFRLHYFFNFTVTFGYKVWFVHIGYRNVGM